MTENEAIKLIENHLKLHSKDLSSKYKNGLRMAINALKKQDKIKEAFTHYVFSGNKFDVYYGCLSALSEIKSILWSE